LFLGFFLKWLVPLGNRI